jgi:hypothetical protein
MTETDAQRFLYLILDLVGLIILGLRIRLMSSTSGNFSLVLFQPLYYTNQTDNHLDLPLETSNLKGDVYLQYPQSSQWEIEGFR